MNRSTLDNVSEQYSSLAQYNILIFGMKNIILLLGEEWVEESRDRIYKLLLF